MLLALISNWQPPTPFVTARLVQYDDFVRLQSPFLAVPAPLWFLRRKQAGIFLVQFK